MSRLLLLATVWLAISQLTNAESLFFQDVNLPCHVLPANIKPTHYDVQLKFPSLDSDHYEGHVRISVDFIKNKASKLAALGLKRDTEYERLIKMFEGVDCRVNYRDGLVLHSDVKISIESIEVLDELNRKVEIAQLSRDTAKQMIAINFKNDYRGKTSGSISISFKGTLRQDMRGVYLSTYNDGNQVYKHIVSQFQPTDARTVFPCFDEPRFRVPFSVKVTHPNGLSAYGNMQVESSVEDKLNSLTTTTFKITPKMPIHMVAFTVGQFDELTYTLESPTTQSMGGEPRKRLIRIITAPGKRSEGNFALQVAADTFRWFEDYIGFEYPLEKLDIVAIADHDKDNTESWGLTFVRDTLLWIDDETKPDTRVNTAVNVAHVVVHQWFGNLVSAGRWSDLWITEGVAAQFAFKMVQEQFSFNSEYFVRLSIHSGVMKADQAGNLHPLAPKPENLKTSAEIYAIFDNLEFMKSASLAQMIEDAIGEPTYREVLNLFVAKFAYKPITHSDYKATLKKLVQQHTLPKVVQMIDSFVAFKGTPLVNYRLNEWTRQLKINVVKFAEANADIKEEDKVASQDVSFVTSTVMGTTVERLFYSGGLYLAAKAGERFYNILRAPFDDNYASTNWIEVSKEPTFANYFRTRFDKELLEVLKVAIKKRALNTMDRLQILDDANVLAQAGLMDAASFSELLDAYEDDTFSGVVIAILDAQKTLATLTKAQNPKPSKSTHAVWEFYEMMKYLTRPNFIAQRAIAIVSKELIMQGNQEAINDALEQYESTKGSVALYRREAVYTAIVLSGSEHVQDLLAHLSETKSYEEKVRLVTALTLSKDKDVLLKVKAWLESSGLKAATIKPFLDTIKTKLS